MVAGTISKDENSIVLSLSKMNRILSLKERVVTCDTGVVLQDLQDYLSPFGLETPYDLGARGSCMIGGNISTHAGGLNFVRHGPLRSYVQELEFVDGRGQVVTAGNRLIQKNNTGFDLKQLLIGSEGYFGIITRVSMLCPEKDTEKKLLFIRVRNFERVLKVHNISKRLLSKNLHSIELMDKASYDFVHHFKKDSINFPFELDSDPKTFYLLVEISGKEGSTDRLLELFYEELLGESVISEKDCVLAETMEQSKSLWKIRESVVSCQSLAGNPLKYDISVDIKLFDSLIEEFIKKVKEGDPNAFVGGYGHIGDGNIHLHVSSSNAEAVQKMHKDVDNFVYDFTARNNGSISAEHGIGRSKKKALKKIRTNEESEIVRGLKKVFDPDCVLNPAVTFGL